MTVVADYVIPPKDGYSVIVPEGHHLRVTDLEGKQAVSMAVFRADNHREKLSLSFSRTRYIPKPGEPFILRDRLTEGDWLMSTLCRPLMTMVEETPEPKAIHKVHGRSCNRLLFEYAGVEVQDGCHEIIAAAVKDHGIGPEQIPDTIDLFANLQHNCDQRRWEVREPVSKAGDYVEFRAEVDCLVALSNCPDEHGLTATNGGRLTPVRVEVLARA
jgi:uncharacterized protein YcgI (DUF1989 family)